MIWEILTQQLAKDAEMKSLPLKVARSESCGVTVQPFAVPWRDQKVRSKQSHKINGVTHGPSQSRQPQRSLSAVFLGHLS